MGTQAATAGAYPRYPELDGAVVIVTGAAGGIGRAIAALFAAQGARVVVAGRSLEPLEEMAADLPDAMAVRCDIAEEAAVAGMVAAAVERWGRLDALVANAGTMQRRARVIEMDLGEWRRVLDVNLTGTMLCAKHAAPALARDGGGSIVNVGSLSGHVPRLMNGAYAASKAAVEHLTRTLALELAADGVRVNAVTPGSTRTPMLQQAIDRDRHGSSDYRVAGDTALFRSPIPLGRIGTPEEQAGPVVFLASRAAGFMTGQVLSVDGGESML